MNKPRKVLYMFLICILIFAYIITNKNYMNQAKVRIIVMMSFIALGLSSSNVYNNSHFRKIFISYLILMFYVTIVSFLNNVTNLPNIVQVLLAIPALINIVIMIKYFIELVKTKYKKNK